MSQPLGRPVPTETLVWSLQPMEKPIPTETLFWSLQPLERPVPTETLFWALQPLESLLSPGGRPASQPFLPASLCIFRLHASPFCLHFPGGRLHSPGGRPASQPASTPALFAPILRADGRPPGEWRQKGAGWPAVRPPGEKGLACKRMEAKRAGWLAVRPENGGFPKAAEPRKVSQ